MGGIKQNSVTSITEIPGPMHFREIVVCVHGHLHSSKEQFRLRTKDDEKNTEEFLASYRAMRALSTDWDSGNRAIKLMPKNKCM